MTPGRLPVSALAARFRPPPPRPAPRPAAPRPVAGPVGGRAPVGQMFAARPAAPAAEPAPPAPVPTPEFACAEEAA